MISVAAELSGMHPQTLRIYERRGLVAPARTGGGSRRYSEADISASPSGAGADDEGLNLAGVRRFWSWKRRMPGCRRRSMSCSRRAAAAVEETHRQYRRDLVPLRQAVERYGWRPPEA